MKRLILFAILACAITPGFAHKVRVDFDHGAQFSRYKTYRVVQAPNGPSPDPVFPNQLVDQRIGGFIEEALAAKGLKRTTTGEDLRVCYRIKVIPQPIYTTFSDGWGPGWGWGSGWGPGWGSGWGSGWGPGWGTGYSTTTVQVVYQGVLVVDVVDMHQQKVVFEGTSEQAVSSRPEKNTKKLAKAVTEVMARYPPQP
jgi:hypothetical protein